MSDLQRIYVDGEPRFLVHKGARDAFIAEEVASRYGEGRGWEAVEEGFTPSRTDEVRERLTREEEDAG